jgi:hypothetical protein
VTDADEGWLATHLVVNTAAETTAMMYALSVHCRLPTEFSGGTLTCSDVHFIPHRRCNELLDCTCVGSFDSCNAHRMLFVPLGETLSLR